MSIGERLTSARLALRLTTRDLAVKSGLDRQTIKRLESGSGSITALSKIAGALGLQFSSCGQAVGELVRGRRHELRLSGQALADRSKLSKPTIIALERSSGLVASLEAAMAAMSMRFEWTWASGTMLLHGDCLDVLPDIASDSVEMIFCDLPYGTTAYAWDQTIPLEPLWTEFERILTQTGVVIFTATYPFTSKLMVSNEKWFKFSLVWQRSRVTGHVHAKQMPLRVHEDILVFSPGVVTGTHRSARQLTYNPQGVTALAEPRHRTAVHIPKYLRTKTGSLKTQTHQNFPTSIIAIPSEGSQLVQTQKPVALMEYLVQTFSNVGDTVLDPTMGSGTTGVAALGSGRNFIGIEKHPDHFRIAQNRIAEME